MSNAKYLLRGGNARDSPDNFNQKLVCLSGVIEVLVMREVRGKPFVGIGLNESTNRSSEKHLVVIMRYIYPMLIMKT